MRLADYRIGWICALPTEIAAAICMLDDRHEALPQPDTDDNSYTYGSVGPHNIVIAGLPAGRTGLTSAASVVEQMRMTFVNLQFGFMVGIAGGVPSSQNDIRLGDVVVSKPGGSYGGVIQFDFGKTIQQGRFIQTGFLNKPPDLLLNAVNNLQARMMSGGSLISAIVREAAAKFPTRQQAHTYPGADMDELYRWSYDHVVNASPQAESDQYILTQTTSQSSDDHNSSQDRKIKHMARQCEACDRQNLVQRSPRLSDEPMIHYGLIASGNQVMRDGSTRERLRKELDVLCFEMEAAGIMARFPCLVVRGICDYADSHKNKLWQDYASVTAAAYTKALLNTIPSRQISSDLQIPGIAQSAMQTLSLQPDSSPFDLGLHLNDAPDLPSSHFVGRGLDLQKMQQILRPNSDVKGRTTLVIGGMGGVGKTQLAIKYAKQFGDCHSSTFWLDATSTLTLSRSLAKLAASVQDHPPELEADNDLMLKEALKWLSKKGNDSWLLIYDNYDNPEDFNIADYYPSASHGSVLITTRSPNSVIGEPVALSPFSNEDESLGILEVRSGRQGLKQDEGARQIIKRLDGLPLALATAGVFLKRSSITCKDYLKLYEAKWSTNQRGSKGIPDYPGRNLYATWDCSFSAIESEHPTAARLLLFLGYLDHGRVWYDLLHSASISGCPAWFKEFAEDRVAFEEAMMTLVDFSLVNAQHESGHYSLHVCVWDWIFERLNKDLDVVHYDMALVCNANSFLLHENKADFDSGLYVAHALHLTHPRFAEITHPKNATRFVADRLYDIAQNLYGYEQFATAEVLFEKVISINQEQLGPYHQDTLDTYDFYGCTLLVQDKSEAAARVLQETVVKYRESKSSSPKFLSALQSLIALHSQTQNLASAANCGLQLIEVVCNGFQLDTYETLGYCLASIRALHQSGQMTLARQLFRETVRHVDVACSQDQREKLKCLQELGEYLVTQRHDYVIEDLGEQALSFFDKLLQPLSGAKDEQITSQMTSRMLARAVMKRAVELAEREMQESGNPFSGGFMDNYIQSLAKLCFLTKGTNEDVESSAGRLIRLRKMYFRKEYWPVTFLCRVTAALVSVGNLKDAATCLCYATVIALERRGGSTCGTCDNCFLQFKFHMTLHICTECYELWLCEACMARYLAEKIVVLEQCADHQFFTVNVPEDFTFNENEFDAWFETIEKRYCKAIG